jgi:hypothetical protein
VSSDFRVVGIVGSYRRGGYCDQLTALALELAAARGAAVDTIRLADHDIGFCTNCRGCTQQPGAAQVPCVVHRDDMQQLLGRIATADALVIAAPVNAGNLNALTQRFAERCVGFYYWPFATRGGPKLRSPRTAADALVISTSAAPRFFNNRLFGFGAEHGLRWLCRSLGARVAASLKVGMLDGPEPVLADGDMRRLRRAASRLLDGLGNTRR